MKLSLQDKIDRGMALNVSELMAATGYGRVAIKRMKPPLVEGKIRLSDFWNHVSQLYGPLQYAVADLEHAHKLLKAVSATPAPMSDLPSIVDKLREPSPKHVQPVASQNPSESRPRSIWSP